MAAHAIQHTPTANDPTAHQPKKRTASWSNSDKAKPIAAPLDPTTLSSTARAPGHRAGHGKAPQQSIVPDLDGDGNRSCRLARFLRSGQGPIRSPPSNIVVGVRMRHHQQFRLEQPTPAVGS